MPFSDVYCFFYVGSYSYSVGCHYAAEYEYTIQDTIRTE